MKQYLIKAYKRLTSSNRERYGAVNRSEVVDYCGRAVDESPPQAGSLSFEETLDCAGYQDESLTSEDESDTLDPSDGAFAINSM